MIDYTGENKMVTMSKMELWINQGQSNRFEDLGKLTVDGCLFLALEFDFVREVGNDLYEINSNYDGGYFNLKLVV